MRKFAICLVFAGRLALPSVGQEAASAGKASVSCTF